MPLPSSSVPACTVVPPLWLLAASRRTLPAPSRVRPWAPVIGTCRCSRAPAEVSKRLPAPRARVRPPLAPRKTIEAVVWVRVRPVCRVRMRAVLPPLPLASTCSTSGRPSSAPSKVMRPAVRLLPRLICPSRVVLPLRLAKYSSVPAAWAGSASSCQLAALFQEVPRPLAPPSQTTGAAGTAARQQSHRPPQTNCGQRGDPGRGRRRQGGMRLREFPQNIPVIYLK